MHLSLSDETFGEVETDIFLQLYNNPSLFLTILCIVFCFFNAPQGVFSCFVFQIFPGSSFHTLPLGTSCLLLREHFKHQATLLVFPASKWNPKWILQLCTILWSQRARSCIYFYTYLAKVNQYVFMQNRSLDHLFALVT